MSTCNVVNILSHPASSRSFIPYLLEWQKIMPNLTQPSWSQTDERRRNSHFGTTIAIIIIIIIVCTFGGRRKETRGWYETQAQHQHPRLDSFSGQLNSLPRNNHGLTLRRHITCFFYCPAVSCADLWHVSTTEQQQWGGGRWILVSFYRIHLSHPNQRVTLNSGVLLFLAAHLAQDFILCESHVHVFKYPIHLLEWPISRSVKVNKKWGNWFLRNWGDEKTGG